MLFRDDGSVANEKAIILRVPGKVTEVIPEPTDGAGFFMPYPADGYLFLLTPTPDGEAYGLATAMDVLYVSPENLVFMSNGQPLAFGESGKQVNLLELAELLNVTFGP